MDAVFSAIAFLNWERNLAAKLGIPHGFMKDHTKRGTVKVGMTAEQAAEAIKKWNEERPR